MKKSKSKILISKYIKDVKQYEERAFQSILIYLNELANELNSIHPERIDLVFITPYGDIEFSRNNVVYDAMDRNFLYNTDSKRAKHIFSEIQKLQCLISDGRFMSDMVNQSKNIIVYKNTKR